jgi:DNA-binding LacI/PurR family transcriptional regulator
MNTSTKPNAPKLTSKRGRDELHESLYQAITSGQLKAGQRVAPLRDLAKQYDISYSTARSVVQELEAAGLVKREHNKQSIVVGPPTMEHKSVNLDTSSHHTLNRSISILYDARNGITGPVVNQLTEMMLDHGLRASVFGRKFNQPLEQFDELLSYWASHPPQAVVNCFSPAGLHEAIARVCGKQTRYITLACKNKISEHSTWHSVEVDNTRLGQLAVDHLLELGHQRIGLVTHEREMSPRIPAWYNRKSHTGHTDHILALGHALRNRNMRHAMTILYQVEEYDQEGTAPQSRPIIEQAKQWLRKPDRPTAFVGDDFRLAYVMLAARELGLTPGKDFDFVGMGNTQWSQIFNFSSIDYAPQQVAKSIIQLIELDGSHWDNTPMSIRIPPTLVKRTLSNA